MRWFWSVVLIFAGILAGRLELPKNFGAHPWWAAQVVWIGGGIGLVLWLGLLLSGVPRRVSVPVLTLLAVFSALAAWQGKERFAASFAEDALAGQFWYFGWIAFVAFLICLGLTAIGGLARGR